MEVDYRYHEYGEAGIFLLRLSLDRIPVSEREIFRLGLIDKIKKYEFVKKTKEDPPHPNSVASRKKIKTSFEHRFSLENTFQAFVTFMQGYYQKGTAERVKRYIVDNL